MSNITPVGTKLTIRQQAEAELATENAKKALTGMKALLARRQAAQTIVDNIDREIADFEAAIEQGNLPKV